MLSVVVSGGLNIAVLTLAIASMKGVMRASANQPITLESGTPNSGIIITRTPHKPKNIPTAPNELILSSFKKTERRYVQVGESAITNDVKPIGNFGLTAVMRAIGRPKPVAPTIKKQ